MTSASRSANLRAPPMERRRRCQRYLAPSSRDHGTPGGAQAPRPPSLPARQPPAAPRTAERQARAAAVRDHGDHGQTHVLEKKKDGACAGAADRPLVRRQSSPIATHPLPARRAESDEEAPKAEEKKEEESKKGIVLDEKTMKVATPRAARLRLRLPAHDRLGTSYFFAAGIFYLFLGLIGASSCLHRRLRHRRARVRQVHRPLQGEGRRQRDPGD